jgi:hypothetical protein
VVAAATEKAVACSVATLEIVVKLAPGNKVVFPQPGGPTTANAARASFLPFFTRKNSRTRRLPVNLKKTSYTLER